MQNISISTTLRFNYSSYVENVEFDIILYSFTNDKKASVAGWDFLYRKTEEKKVLCISRELNMLLVSRND